MFKRKYKSLEAQHEAKLVELVRLKKKLDDVTPESEDAIEHLKSIILNKETKIEQIESKISDLTRANEEAGKEITRLRLSENKSRPNLREDADLNREVLRVKEELKKKDERIKKLEKNRITKEALEKINKIKVRQVPNW
jgi:chromosome segregation ATPase